MATSIVLGKNVIPLCELREDSNALENIIRGRNGITEAAKAALAKGHYTDALAALWSAKTFEERITWMREAADSLHAPFIYELALAEFEAICEKDRETGEGLYSDERKIEVLNTVSLPLIRAAQFLTRQAAQCSKDDSVYNGDADQRLKNVYIRLIVKVMKEKTAIDPSTINEDSPVKLAAYRRKLEEVVKRSLEIDLPDPKWVTYNGMGTFQGERKMHPKSQWNELRHNYAKKVMANIYPHSPLVGDPLSAQIRPIIEADSSRSFVAVYKAIMDCMKENKHITLQMVENELRRNNCLSYLIALPPQRGMDVTGNLPYYLHISGQSDESPDALTIKNDKDAYKRNLLNLGKTGFLCR